MSQVLDLSITFTPPPVGSDPDVLATIALNYGASGLSYAGDVLRDPLDKQEREDLRWYLEEYWQWPYGLPVRIDEKIPGLCTFLGMSLFDLLQYARRKHSVF